MKIIPRKLNILVCISIFSLLLACSQQPVSTSIVDAVFSAEQESKANTIDQSQRKPAMTPIKADKPKEKAKRFDISVKASLAKDFFSNLMTATDTNIIVDPEIDGEITLALKQVTIDELLSVVSDIYGYAYVYENNIYRIYSKKLRTEIFPINYIDVKRVGVSDTSVLTGNIESSSQSSSSGAQDSQQADLIGSGNSISPGSRIQTRSEVDFWHSLRLSIAELIGANHNLDDDSTVSESKVIVNPQTGVVVVTAMPDKLASVKRFLKSAQLTIKRQVIIEAKILEIELSQGYQAGINWEEINGQLLLSNNVSEFSSPNSIVTASEAVGEVFSSIVKVTDITKLLSLLKTQGNVQVLSSPRISTVNNQKAVIRVGSDRFFVTGVSNTTTTSSGSTTNNPDVELSSFFSGISLDVTPQISSEENIILHIHPVISTVTEEIKQISVGDSSFSLPLAFRDIRESDSIVSAGNGQIIVLGGLMQEKTVTSDGKRPFVGDIPIVNSFFKTTKKNQIKSELIILLKPTIVEASSWNSSISESKARIDQWQSSKDY